MNQHLCEEHSEKLLLDLNTMLAEWREERTTNASAARRSSGMLGAAADSGMHVWCGHATVMVLVSSASGTHVSGYMRAPRAPNYELRLQSLQRLHLQMPDCHTSKFVTSKKEVEQYFPILLCFARHEL